MAPAGSSHLSLTLAGALALGGAAGYAKKGSVASVGRAGPRPPPPPPPSPLLLPSPCPPPPVRASASGWSSARG